VHKQAWSLKNYRYVGDISVITGATMEFVGVPSGGNNERKCMLKIFALTAPPRVESSVSITELDNENDRDFYFRALRSLVVLSFPQLVSFSSVFPKPLSKTLRRSSDGGFPFS
jgi:hypothetical protein